MAKQYLPSVETLRSSDDERLLTELRLSEVRDQVAHAQHLLDTVEVGEAVGSSRRDRPSPCPPAFAEELARLGCRLVEIASALSRSSVVMPSSGDHLHL